MKRRAFLATVPSLLALSGQGRAAEGVKKGAVLIVTLGPLHSRVRRSIESLADELRKRNFPVDTEARSVFRDDHRQQIVIGVLSEDTQIQLRRMGRESPRSLQPDHFELEARPGWVFVLGGDHRGLVYAISQLRRLIALQGQLPAALKMTRQPVFPVRRWSTAVSHNFGSPWDERIYLAQRFAYIKSEILPRACEYGMNSVEINGRPGDGWDIDWVIGFEKYPKLSALFAPGVRKNRLALVEDLAKAAHQNLLQMFVWGHELHLPEGFLELYPQAAGVNYPVCLHSEFLRQFIRDKYREFFAGAPSVDGLVMSVAESGRFNLLTDRGCQCNQCKVMAPHERVRAVLDIVVSAAFELKKQIVLRTFLTSWIRDLDGHPEMETLRKAYTNLPPDVWVMSKYCPLDFYGEDIADDPLIGAFPNPSLVEFSLDVEWQGRTFVPVLTPGNFRRRISHALSKGCKGIVARVDFPFPTMEPEAIFGHPNDFNAWYMGELLWDPASPIDESLLKWSRLRYGKEAAPSLSSALRKTEAITQKTFFCLGQTVINYHNMIAGVSFCDNSLWFTALSKWDPSKRELSRSFFQPDENLIARARQEKQDAITLAQEALDQLIRARGKLPELEYQRRLIDFQKLRDTAQLWDYLLELYLRHRQIASSPVKAVMLEAAMAAPGNKGVERLLRVARSALQMAVEMELRNGRDSWPVVSPDRGISAYEFVHQILRHYVGCITGEPVEDRVMFRNLDLVFTNPSYQPDSTEAFWLKLVESGRPGFEIGSATRASLKWPRNLRSLRLSDFDLHLADHGGRSMAVPLSFPVREISLSGSGDVSVSIRKDPGILVVERA